MGWMVPHLRPFLSNGSLSEVEHESKGLRRKNELLEQERKTLEMATSIVSRSQP